VRVDEHIRYEPNEECPLSVSIGVALQGVMISLATAVPMVTIMVRAGGQDEGTCRGRCSPR
jgi:hypothetical protein